MWRREEDRWSGAQEVLLQRQHESWTVQAYRTVAKEMMEEAVVGLARELVDQVELVRRRTEQMAGNMILDMVRNIDRVGTVRQLSGIMDELRKRRDKADALVAKNRGPVSYVAGRAKREKTERGEKRRGAYYECPFPYPFVLYVMVLERVTMTEAPVENGNTCYTYACLILLLLPLHTPVNISAFLHVSFIK